MKKKKKKRRKSRKILRLDDEAGWIVTATANKSETIEPITRYIMRDKNAVAKRQIDR